MVILFLHIMAAFVHVKIEDAFSLQKGINVMCDVEFKGCLVCENSKWNTTL